jgi:riboflavin kinase/FMN adenylyltransferase
MATHPVEWQAVFPEVCRHAAVTIGNFDGAHRGHAALVAEVRRQAAALGGPAVAVTFDPRPIELLRPGLHAPPLSTLADRTQWLHDLGADHVLVLHTTPELLSLSPAAFFEEVLLRRLSVRALVEGENFAFGHDRAGDVHTLEALGRPAGVEVTVVPPVVLEGVPISSSRIREAILAGEVALARELLGRPHRLYGVVGRGQQRGARLGFPTANLESLATLVPGDGVYAARAYLGAISRLAAVNVGPNPTFAEQERKVEAHILDLSGDLYGQSLRLDFLSRLRDTRPFRDVTELIEQLHRDVEQVKRTRTE